MNRYLVESSHTKEEYRRIACFAEAMGHITHYDWGCSLGIHRGWAIVEAESEMEALLSVPPLIRRKAKAIKLNRFSPETVIKLHEQS